MKIKFRVKWGDGAYYDYDDLNDATKMVKWLLENRGHPSVGGIEKVEIERIEVPS